MVNERKFNYDTFPKDDEYKDSRGETGQYIYDAQYASFPCHYCYVNHRRSAERAQPAFANQAIWQNDNAFTNANFQTRDNQYQNSNLKEPSQPFPNINFRDMREQLPNTAGQSTTENHMLQQFLTEDGQVDIQKMLKTIGQFADTVQQVSPVIKQINDLVKSFRT